MKVYVVTDKYSDHVFGVGLFFNVAQRIAEDCGGECIITEIVVGAINWEEEQ